MDEGGGRTSIAAGLMILGQLLHTVFGSWAAESLYRTGAIRLVVVCLFAALVLRSRKNYGRWILVILGLVWGFGYSMQSLTRGSVELGIVAACVIAGACLLLTKPVRDYVTSDAA